MIHASEIWDIIQANMPRGRWLFLKEIYELVDMHGVLDDEDFEPQSPTSDIPKWKRNVLQRRKEPKGVIHWDGHARYMMP